MVRPQDYGDRFPGDGDDTAPANPTDGYTEVDYDISSLKGKEIVAGNPPNLVPNPDVDFNRGENIRVFAAIVMEEVDPADPAFLPNSPTAQRWCLRQDGKRVAAYALTLENYERFKTGDDVILRSDNQQEWDSDANNHWIMIGKSRPTELPVLDVYLSADAGPFNNVFTVPFDAIKEQLPIDDTFGGFNELAFTPPSVTVKRDGQSLYHLEFSVTLEHVDAVEQANIPFAQKGCFVENDLDGTSDGAELVARKMWFSGQNGFRVLWDPDDCSANITLGSQTCRDSVLNQRQVRKFEPALWTDSPRFGGSVWIAKNRATGYAKIGNRENYVWLTHGFGRLKFRFPANGPLTKPSFLVAIAGKDECVQTGWMPIGGKGEIKAQSTIVDHYDYCYIYIEGADPQFCARPVYQEYTWTVCQGLIVSGPGILPNGESPCNLQASEYGTVECPDDYECNDNPCL